MPNLLKCKTGSTKQDFGPHSTAIQVYGSKGAANVRLHPQQHPNHREMVPDNEGVRLSHLCFNSYYR